MILKDEQFDELYDAVVPQDPAHAPPSVQVVISRSQAFRRWCSYASMIQKARLGILTTPRVVPYAWQTAPYSSSQEKSAIPSEIRRSFRRLAILKPPHMISSALVPLAFSPANAYS